MVINSLENIRSSIDLEERALAATSFRQAQELLKLSIAELEDAIEVLSGAHLHPTAQTKLRRAAAIENLALLSLSDSAREGLINQAITLKRAARAEMANN